MSETKFLEIEHKYLVAKDFNLDLFRSKLAGLGFKKKTQIKVRDTYYLTSCCDDFIYRHRFDEELQHLTVKSLTGDSELRVEVNLDLGHHCGNQAEAVEAFLKPQAIVWSGSLVKQVEAYYFEDAEIVYYEACAGTKEVNCVEIEAKDQSSIALAKRVLAEYAERLDLDVNTRSERSLFQILLSSQLPDDLSARFSHMQP